MNKFKTEFSHFEIEYDGAFKNLIRAGHPITTGDYINIGRLYRRLLLEFVKLNGTSIAIPFFPYTIFADHRRDVFKEVQNTIVQFLDEHEMTIYLIVDERHQIEIDKSIKMKLDKRIDMFMDYGMMSNKIFSYENVEDVIENKLDNIDEGFSQTLLSLINETGEKDSTIYKRANVDRRLFSKVRSNPYYQPSKKTALAFAIALHLSYHETLDFIARAGYTLSKQLSFDIVVSEYIRNNIFDIFEINNALFMYDLELF